MPALFGLSRAGTDWISRRRHEYSNTGRRGTKKPLPKANRKRPPKTKTLEKASAPCDPPSPSLPQESAIGYTPALSEHGRCAGRRSLRTAQHAHHRDRDLRQSIDRERPIRDGGDVASRTETRATIRPTLEHAKATLETKEAAANAAKLQVRSLRPRPSASCICQRRPGTGGRKCRCCRGRLDSRAARVQQDEAVAGRAERDRVRYAALVEKHEISRSFYDARMTEAAATAQTASDVAAVQAAQQRIAEAKSIVAEREAQIASARTAPQQYLGRGARISAEGELDQARADVHTAELNLSYSRIYAPVSGVVGHKTVELGHRIQPGQSLLTVVPLDDIWITANFKETQLRRMHPGSPSRSTSIPSAATIRAPSRTWPAHRGPLFSLFPSGERERQLRRRSCSVFRSASTSTRARIRNMICVLVCPSKLRSKSDRVAS